MMMVMLAPPRRAHAEPNAADVETARGLYVEGLELRDAGRLDVSLARFKAAHALAATPITSLELGRAHALLAQLVEAREMLLSIERLPVLPAESSKAASARLEARALAEQLRDRIPTVRIVLAPEPPSAPRVTIDGVAVPADALASPRKVNPGTHLVVAEANGARTSASVLVAERDARIVTLSWPAPGAAGPSSPSPEPGAAASTGRSEWFYVGLAGAGAGVVVGTITGALAIAKANNLETECTGSACPHSAADDLSTSRTMGVVSTIAFAVAAGSAAVALVAWLSHPTSATAVRRSQNALRWSW